MKRDLPRDVAGERPPANQPRVSALTIMSVTLLDLAIMSPDSVGWRNADWAMYERALERLNGGRAFVTYYRGKLEVVSPSFQHDRTASLLYMLVKILSEELDMPIVSARSTTLQRKDLQAAVEADDAFYIRHAARMSQPRRDVDLSSDPPPDLVIEVEITSRLRERIDIYREMGVPEVWRYPASGLVVLLNRGDRWEQVERSPTFPQFSPAEITGFITAGLAQDETTWAKGFRGRVRAALGTK